MVPLALGAACSGINATKSISPLDFLLPGLLKVEPQVAPINTNALARRDAAEPGGRMVAWVDMKPLRAADFAKGQLTVPEPVP